MNNSISENTTNQCFDLSSYEVEPGYFQEQSLEYEKKYKREFPGGWGEFFGLYSSGRTDKGNLDYDEWAFLCEHFMIQELTHSSSPPGKRDSCREEPETISGFSFAGEAFVRPYSVLRNCKANSCRML